MTVDEKNLPRALKYYSTQDFALRKRANFLYNFILAAIIVSTVLFFTTCYIQTINPLYGKPQPGTVGPILLAIAAFGSCLMLLIRGRIVLASNMLITVALAVVWVVLFREGGDGLSKINTIVFVFAAIAMLPLVVNSKRQILYFGLVNLLLFLFLLGTMYLNRDAYEFSVYGYLDSLVDISAALIFSVVIHYNVFSINRISLQKAREEIEERGRIAEELQFHKDNLERLVKEKTENLEAVNEELKAANEDLFDKNDVIYRKNEELVAAMENLRETQAQLIQAEKMASLGTLTSGVAHEINNPLNFLMGAYFGLDTYFRENGADDERKTAILLESIRTGIERISNIVKGLDQFSRDESNLDEDCELHPLIDNCLVMLSNQLRFRVTINKQYSEETLQVKGNIGKLHHVFYNVLHNASQAIGDEGEIGILTRTDKKNVIIEINDNGCGISRENLGRITEPFFTTKPAGMGTGLGLSIAYSIIREHKGSITFDSEPGRGTRVQIKLPSKKVTHE
ncbi:MAG: sensor histidine kinase [Bacteroidota bacterium]